MLQKIIHSLFPSTCLLCKNLSHRTINLCKACETELPWIKNYCRQCGVPLAVISTVKLCGSCLSSPPYFDNTVTCFHYQSPIDKLIIGLKFNHHLYYARLLGSLLAQQIMATNQSLPELIIPVPLHNKRLRQRGFNQALEIAKPIAKQLKIPINYKDCIRNKYTEPQSSLAAKYRNENVKNAFHLKKTLQASHIAIIDDVATTGNTANALAKLLKKTGVKTISLWCCARTDLFS